MANSLFAKGREAFLTGKVNWTGDTIRAALCEKAPDLEKDEFLSSVQSFAVSEPLKGKTSDNGIAGAGNIIFKQVAAKKTAALVLYKDGGSPATSRLLVMIDTLDRGGFPAGVEGGDIQINWSSGPNRIFRL